MYPSGGADVGRTERDFRSAVSLGRGLGLLVPSGADLSSRGGGAGEEVDGVGCEEGELGHSCSCS